MITAEAVHEALDRAYGRAWEGRDPLRTLRRPPSPTAVGSDAPSQIRGYTRLDLLHRAESTILETAYDVGLGREVLLKRLVQPDAPESRARLLREARLMGRIPHPSIVPVHAILEDSPVGPVMVTAAPRGAIPWARRTGGAVRDHVQIALAVARALAHAHAQGVLHLDLKPSNVMLGTFGEVFVIGWGGGRLLEEGATGHPAGTPAYMPYELVRGLAPDEATDVYLLAGCLFHVLTGQPPHSEDGVVQALLASTRIPEVPPAIPSGLSEVVERALDPRPTRRPATMGAFILSLEEFLQSHDSVRITTSVRRLLEGDPDLEVVEDAEQELVAALTLWPSNREARQLLDDVREDLLRRFLAAGDLALAERMAGAIDNLPLSLRAEFERRRRERKEDEVLAARDPLVLSPPEVGRPLAVAWGAIAMGALFFVWAVPGTPLWLMVVLVGVPLAGVLSFVFATRVHRRRASLVALGTSLLGVMLVGRLVGLVSGGDPDLIRVGDLIMVGATMVTASAFHRPFLFLGFGGFAAAAVSAVFPDAARLLLMAVAALGPAVAVTPDATLGVSPRGEGAFPQDG